MMAPEVSVFSKQQAGATHPARLNRTETPVPYVQQPTRLTSGQYNGPLAPPATRVKQMRRPPVRQ